MRYYLYIIMGMMLPTTVGCNSKTTMTASESYVEQAFDSIRFYSFYQDKYNFDSLKSVVLNNLSDTNNSLHEELLSAIKAIDQHSYMLTKEYYSQLDSGNNPRVKGNAYPFRGKILDSIYAYISLNGFDGVDSISSKNYTDSLQNLILDLYDFKPKGWIIDLRYNSGGWVYPMISGLGPILGYGIKAYEIDKNGIEEEFYYYKNDSTYLQLTDSTFILEKELPVAVLIGKETASAGELLSLCFRENKQTILIGQPTYGVATGLKGFFMPDSTQFAITNSIMTDRNKKGDGKSIQPMIRTNDALETFEYAYEWIEKNK